MRKYLLLLLFPMLLSCSSTGGLITVPKTPEEKAVAGFIALDEITKGAKQALNAKKISGADAQHVLTTVRTTRQGIDVGLQLAKVDPKAADAKIAAQMAIIKVLEDYLATKGN